MYILFAHAFSRKPLLLSLTISICVLASIVWVLWLIGFYATRKMSGTYDSSNSCTPDWSIAFVIVGSAVGICSAVLVGVAPQEGAVEAR